MEFHWPTAGITAGIIIVLVGVMYIIAKYMYGGEMQRPDPIRVGKRKVEYEDNEWHGFKRNKNSSLPRQARFTNEDIAYARNIRDDDNSFRDQFPNVRFSRTKITEPEILIPSEHINLS